VYRLLILYMVYLVRGWSVGGIGGSVNGIYVVL
jgi:hypothetical protein